MCSTMGLWCGNKKNTHSVRNICSRSYGSSFWRIIGFIASLAAAACFEIAWNISSSGIGTGKTRKQCERWVEARRSEGDSQVRSVRFGFSGVRILFSIYRLRLVPKSTVQPPRTKMYDLDYGLYGGTDVQSKMQIMSNMLHISLSVPLCWGEIKQMGCHLFTSLGS